MIQSKNQCVIIMHIRGYKKWANKCIYIINWVVQKVPIKTQEPIHCSVYHVSDHARMDAYHLKDPYVRRVPPNHRDLLDSNGKNLAIGDAQEHLYRTWSNNVMLEPWPIRTTHLTQCQPFEPTSIGWWSLAATSPRFPSSCSSHLLLMVQLYLNTL